MRHRFALWIADLRTSWALMRYVTDIRTAACGAVLVFALVAGAAMAQSKVSILVNDEPITSYEIAARGKMLTLFTRGKQGAKDATDQLIEERLMLQEAKRRSMQMGEAEIDEEVAKRAKGSNLSADQFQQAMRSAGVDPKTFRAFLSANMSWSRIVRARFQATEKVSDQDVTAAVAKRKPSTDAVGAPVTISEYMLQPILFIVPAGAAAGTEGRMQKEAVAFRGAYQGCDQAVQQAAGKPGVLVKPTVRRDELSLPKPIRDELAALAVGGIGSPQKVDTGIQLLAICSKQAISGASSVSEAVRTELTSERGNLLARRYLRDLRADAVIEYK